MNNEKQCKVLSVIKNLLPFIVITLFALICVYFDVFSVDNILKITPKNQFIAFIFFLVFYAVKNLSFLFPIAVLYIAAATIFPLPIALIINFLGAIICCTIPYFMGYNKGINVSKFKNAEKIKKIVELEKNNIVFLSYFLRVINILPMDLVSMYLGAKHVDFIKYTFGSMIGNLPGVILVTIMGASIREPLSPTFLISTSISVIISVTSFFIFMIYKNKKLN